MKLDMKTLGDLKPNPVFKGLSKTLKDPKIYKKVEKQLLKIMQAGHKHKNPSSWFKCKDCQIRFNEKRETLKKLGFKSLNQYLEWRKVMEIILKNKK